MPRGQHIIHLRFDRIETLGSQQHYFHFMWGYLMPSLGQILNDTRPGSIFQFESCGPVMDIKIRELCEWLEIPFRICAKDEACEEAGVGESRLVSRWDDWLSSRSPMRVRATAALHRTGLRVRVLEEMDRVVGHLLTAAGCHDGRLEDSDADRASAEMEPRTWLLLKRSEEPAFYGADGAAEKPKYGVGRRAIANLDELADELTQGGLPVRVYEPGQDSLILQIQTFHRAEGVISIRGAEFANVAWMRPGRLALMLATRLNRPHHLISSLGATRRVRVREIPVKSNYPEVSGASILRAIQRMSWRTMGRRGDRSNDSPWETTRANRHLR